MPHDQNKQSPVSPFGSSDTYDVVVVNYNSTDVLLKLLTDFANLGTAPTGIYVIDNGSLDDPGRIAESFPDVDLVLTGKNLGFGRASNLGWRKGRSRYVLFINPDVRLQDDNIGQLMGFLGANADVGIAGPAVLNDDGTVQGSARGFHSFWSILAGRKGPITRWFPGSKIALRDVPLLRHDGYSPIKVDWISGACLMIKRAALEKAGGFDERFFMYFEDSDLCRQVGGMGLATYYVPGMKISHRVGHSSDKRPLSTTLWFHQSWYRYMCKHHFARNPVGQALASIVVGLRLGLMLTLRYAPNLKTSGK